MLQLIDHPDRKGHVTQWDSVNQLDSKRLAAKGKLGRALTTFTICQDSRSHTINKKNLLVLGHENWSLEVDLPVVGKFSLGIFRKSGLPRIEASHSRKEENK